MRTLGVRGRSASRAVTVVFSLVVGAVAGLVGHIAPAPAGTVPDNVGVAATQDGAVIFDADNDSSIATVSGVPNGNFYRNVAVNTAQTLAFLTGVNSKMWVIDLNTQSLAADTPFIPISNPGLETSLSFNGRFLVTCGGLKYAGTTPVSVIDTGLRTEIGTFVVTDQCSGLRVCRDGSVLIVEQNANTIRRLKLDGAGNLSDTGESLTTDTPSNQNSPHAPVEVGCGFDTGSGDTSGVAIEQDGTMISFTIPGLTKVDSISPAQTSYNYTDSLAVSPDGSLAFGLTDQAINEFTFSPVTAHLTLTTQVPFGFQTYSNPYIGSVDYLVFHPNGQQVYVSQYDGVHAYGLTGPFLPVTIPANSPTGISLPPLPLAQVLANCGNGVLDAGEQCDDGNKNPGDGCSDRCEIEPCYTCGTPGQACSQATAGTECRSDGNPCTVDACNDAGTCTHVGSASLANLSCAGTPADDNNPCTSDVCDANGNCNHPVLNDGTPCDDGLACNGTDSCLSGSCVHSGDPCAGACEWFCADLGSSYYCYVKAKGTTCRPAATQCDVAETCDGFTTICPADGGKPAGVLCSQPAGCSPDDSVCDGGTTCASTCNTTSSDPNYKVSALTPSKLTLGASTAASTSLLSNGKIKIEGTLTASNIGDYIMPATGAGGLSVQIKDQLNVSSTTGVDEELDWFASDCAVVKVRQGHDVRCWHVVPGPTPQLNKAIFKQTSSNTYSVSITAFRRKLPKFSSNTAPVRVILKWPMQPATPTWDTRADFKSCTLANSGKALTCK